MTAAEQLVDSLGNANWRVRQVAVDQLLIESSPLLISKVVEMVRHDHRDMARLNAAIAVLARTDVDVLPQLLELLDDPQPDVRAYTALALGERGDTRAIGRLLGVLADSNPNVQVHAIEALGKLQAAAAVDAFMGFVESDDFALAFPAVEALIAIGDSRIAHRLLPLIEHPLLDGSAIEALGRLGDDQAVVPLLNLLDKNPGAPAGQIAAAIRQIHDRQAAQSGSGAAITELVARCASPTAVEALRWATVRANASEAIGLIALLSWIPTTESEETLFDLLDRPDVRDHAVKALATRGAAVADALLERLGSSRASCRPAFIELCGVVADQRTTPWLLNCLEETDDDVLAATLHALSRIGDHRAYAPAKSLLGHESARVRQAAVNVLNALAHPDTARDMSELLRDAASPAGGAALKVAAFYGFPECIDALLALCDHPHEQVQRLAIEHLPCLDDDRVLARLEQALGSESASIRAAAAAAWEEMEPASAIGPLLRALGDEDVWVRYFAVRSLASLRDAASREETTRRLQSLATNDPAPQVRIAAVEALGGESLTTLLELAESADDDLAAAAVATLGKTGRVEAVPALVAAAGRDSSPRLQREAVRALGTTRLAEAVPSLRRAALHRNRVLAEEAIKALANVPGPESVLVLLEVAESPGKRSVAVAALRKLGDGDIKSDAIETVARQLPGLSLDLRRTLASVLGSMRSPRADALLTALLDDAEPAVRHAALVALAGRPADRKPRG
jgi:HEAT repeat protein